jgi:HAD superfamily hydrolase (TIGR01509 family)
MSIEIYRKTITPAIAGVLFDMDGLVLDTEKLYSRFWMEACHFYGFPMTYEQSLKMRAANSQVGAENLRSFFGPDIDYVTVRNKRIELMDGFIAENGVEPKPGIFELMDFLEEQGIPAAICSSSPRNRIQEHLGSLGIYHRFAAICSGYDVPCGKPAPDIYLHGAASLNLKPEECLALEDAPLGIESAFRAGCIPVMIPDQAPPDAKTKAMLYGQADSLLDIIELLK